MDNKFLNPKIYEKAKKIADEVYKRHSAYKSMFLVKKYKELGGKISEEGERGSKLADWRQEQWLHVLPFLKEGKKEVCGSTKEKKSCRPTRKINSKTPLTLNELIKIHGKKKLTEIAEKKVANMDKRMNWRTGKFY